MKRRFDKIYLISLAVILTILFIFQPPAALAEDYIFTPINGIGWAHGINDFGTIVGDYGLYYRGNVTPIIVPGSSYTQSFGINNFGSVVGFYGDPTGNHVFLFENGQYTTIDAPGARSFYPWGIGINDFGTIVGTYADKQGFVYKEGSFTTITAPGESVYGTLPCGINDFGNIVGEVWDHEAYDTHRIAGSGFLYVKGNFTLINVPSNNPGTIWTWAYGVNNFGNIVGDYFDGTTTHGFLDVKGNVTLIDYPGAQNTHLFGINDFGSIVGLSDTGAFLATPVPEPSTMLLLGFGLVGLVGLRRKFKK